ncbi:iron chelate uptake ABC transporter family permease subunit, partial [Streptomyces rubiginosohelvolus]|uniref:iron chelate uptake ABC transporter family permease subunit n=1 Tax=Streptomyces rubiginosohelvolus TaxID=67362 RepID=UPI0033D35961
RGAGRGTPEGLVLAGVAVTAVLGAVVSGLGVLDADAYGTLRMWSVGTLAGRELPVLWEVLPFLLVGAVLALTVAPALDAFALGDEAAPANVPSGCRFRTRCWKAQERCELEVPLLAVPAEFRLVDSPARHDSACHFAEEKRVVPLEGELGTPGRPVEELREPDSGEGPPEP